MAQAALKRGRIDARAEALAGYGLIAIPMVFFLALSIGTFVYAAYISVWDWNIRSGPE